MKMMEFDSILSYVLTYLSRSWTISGVSMYTMCVCVCSFEYICAHVHIGDVIVSMEACECVCLLSHVSRMYTTYSVNCKVCFIRANGGDSQLWFPAKNPRGYHPMVVIHVILCVLMYTI